MDHDFQLVPAQIQMVTAIQELRDCVPVCERYGLSLSEADIKELVSARKDALVDSGRIEFKGGILPKLIYAFSDSPYVDNENWVETLTELQEAFYYYKGDAEERFTDDELIEFMVKVFNGRAQGSAEYLIGSSLTALCRYARQEYDEHDSEDSGDLF